MSSKKRPTEPRALPSSTAERLAATVEAAKRIRHRRHQRDTRRDTRSGGGVDMHEDPTRMMRQPDDHKPHGNTRLLVAGLVAVIVGLIVAVVVIASSGGSDSTVTTTPSE